MKLVLISLLGSMKTAFASISLSTSLRWLQKVSWQRSGLGATRDDFRSLEIRCIDQMSFLQELCCKSFYKLKSVVSTKCCFYKGCFNLMVVVYSTSVWVLCTPIPGQNILFHCFVCKKSWKGRKSKKFDAKFSKKMFIIKFAPKQW